MADFTKREASHQAIREMHNALTDPYIQHCLQHVKGEVIYIAVGQRGTTSSEGAGGGGGSFVVKKSGAGIANAVANDILLIAGGGAGAPHDNQPGTAGHGIHTTSGSGGGGASASGNDNELAAGGGGFTGNGSSTGTANGGLSFINGLTGGSGTNSTGGFGGGGSQFSDGSGGGGGYTGGAGEDGPSFSTSTGGGYSYNSGTNTTGTTGFRSGHGQVVIEQIQVPASNQIINYTQDSYLLFGTRHDLTESGTMEIEDLRIHDSTLSQSELNYVYRHSINVQEGDSLLIEVNFSIPMKDTPIPQFSLQSSDTNQVSNLALTNLTKVNDQLYNYNYVVPSGFATMMAGVSGGYDITNTLQQSNTISFNIFNIYDPLTITNSSIGADDSTITITFSGDLYSTVNTTGDLLRNCFRYELLNNGTATTINEIPSSITHTGGTSTVILGITKYGVTDGSQQVKIIPNHNLIFDNIGRPITRSATNNIVTFSDNRINVTNSNKNTFFTTNGSYQTKSSLFLTEDIIITSNAYLVLNTYGAFYGQGYSITIQNVSNHDGLFELDGGKVMDVHVISSSSTIASEAGWIARKQAYGFIESCSSDGAIPTKSGGIVGSNAATGSKKLEIKNCSSSGNISADAGGIVGEKAGNNGIVVINSCHSSGLINGNKAGGITGSQTAINNGTVTIDDCYSIGNINGDYSNGIVGGYSDGTAGQISQTRLHHACVDPSTQATPAISECPFPPH